MLQSKNRTRKLRRQELANYKRLVKLLDANLGLILKQGLVWKQRYEEAHKRLSYLAEQQVRQKPSGLIYNAHGGLIQ